MRSNRGSSVAAAVCTLALASLAVFTVAALASTNQSMLQQADNAQVASSLADSLIQQAAAILSEQKDWGVTRREHLEMNGPDDRSGAYLTFDAHSGKPYSSNWGSHDRGWGPARLLNTTAIPTDRVHLVAVGQSHNVTRIREAVAYVPKYTNALGASGKVNLVNSVVASVNTTSDAAQVDAHPDLLKPGDLACNDVSAQSATLRNSSRITGNLLTNGGLDKDALSRIEGEKRAGHANLPHFEVADFDPANLSASAFNVLDPGPRAGQTLTGLNKCAGDLTYNGDLKLDNSLLYVQGDLTLSGSLQGTGAIIVGGSVAAHGGADLVSDDAVALVARGDVTLQGTSRADYAFQGVVYTQGNLRASRCKIVGAFVADGNTPGRGNVNLTDCVLLRSDTEVHFTFFAPIQIVFKSAGGPGYTLHGATESLAQDKLVYNSGWVDHDRRNQSYVFPDVGQAEVTPAAALRHDNLSTLDAPHTGWEFYNPVLLTITREGADGRRTYRYQFNEGGRITTLGPYYDDVADDDHASFIQAFVDLMMIKCPAATLRSGVQATRDNIRSLVLDRGGFQAQDDMHHPIALPANALDTPADIPWADQGKISGTTDNFEFDLNRFLLPGDTVRIQTSTEY